ncbi:uncharacterized protein K441DRAFT_581098, partial [Cenococcum geophilum 1.58]|uniref:uncharacterized protein n=1 Tax=Cenococcum geophilum 1.58 TaxID=794803 RepID=UPI00358F13BB
KYLDENLSKGFIRASLSPIAILVIFIKKPSKELCFYINYYKLNNIAHKDRYPLPLLNKTLA